MSTGYKPEVGDVWVGEDQAGNPITRPVTEVLPGLQPEDDWRISLDGDGPTQVSWWWGLGWDPLDSE